MTPAGEGMLLVDKPAGPTSHDVVASVRRITGAHRVGHTGTLDPPATGLLVILLGRATRLARFLPAAPKVYAGTLQLGVRTLTDDLAGRVMSRHEGPLPEADAVVEAGARLVGRSLQVPPAVSARSVDGERLYRAARRGRPKEAPPAPIEVDAFELAPGDGMGVFAYRVSVSAGTYVRGLARDLGEALGCGAALATLRRTAIGPLRVEDAIVWRGIPVPDAATLAAAIVPLDAIPLAAASIVLTDGADRDRFLHGVRIAVDLLPADGGPVAVRDARGALLGIARAEAGILVPQAVLPDPAGL